MSNYIMPTYDQPEICFSRGEGSYLYDLNGKKYLDFSCGISVTNFGHKHPYLIECLVSQSNSLWHTSNLFSNPIVEKLAKRLVDATFPGKVFFCNSGAEANEAAIKLVRLYNNKVHGGTKKRILTMKDGFHGRTMATLSATAQKKIQAGFEPILPDFTYIDYNDKRQLELELDKGDVFAVMLELIQGESGVMPADPDFVKHVRELTQKHSVLMIVDEVQTGFGRTGKLFAFQHYGIVPDILTMAKAMANGIPMGGLLASKSLSALFSPGTHGSTFGGNLIASSVANGVLDLLTSEMLDCISSKGQFAIESLRKELGNYALCIRGKGLMIGVVLPENISNTDVIKECLKNGLVIIKGGRNSIRFYPPLNTDFDQISDGISILSHSIRWLTS